MKRCRWIAPLPFFAAAAVFSCLSAWAQGNERAGAAHTAQPSASESAAGNWRQFPLKAQRGNLRITATPEVLMNGKADRLSPGSRIRNIQNSVVTPMSLGDATYVVNYLRNAQGDIHDVWLLTPDEAKARLPSMAASDRRREPSDDGKTPFDQLPKWNQATPR